MYYLRRDGQTPFREYLRYLYRPHPVDVRMSFVVLGALLWGCVTPCRTTCGLRADVGRPACEELQEQEDRVLTALERTAGLDWDVTCPALRGWKVVTHEPDPKDGLCEAPGWYHEAGLCVVGFTHRETQRVELTGALFRSNALSHELIHVIQIRRGLPVGHCGWKRDRIKDALREAGAGEDDARLPTDCEP